MKSLITLLVLCLTLSGCSQIAQFTLHDAQSAKARAQRGGDAAGERCWTYMESMLTSDGMPQPDIAGVMDAVEAARLARLQAPHKRQELMAGCGEVFADVIVELARRAARRGF